MAASTDRAPLLTVEDLTMAFGYLRALDGLDLAVDAGESVAILGPNGAGKSTLLRTVATLSRPTEGRVRIDGRDVHRDDAVRGRLGFFGHDTMLYDDLTAIENVRLHGRLHGIQHVDERANTLLDRVGLATRAGERPGRFSHGMRKRLSLARALVHDPDVLLLDEPHAGLDRRSGDRFAELLATVADRTILLTTHDLGVATRYASRAVVLAAGRRLDEVDLRGVTDPSVLERRYQTAVSGGDR